MSEIVISSSNNSVDKAIDKYHDTISYSGSSNASSNSSNSSRRGNTTNEQHTFGVLRIPLEVFQEQLRTKAASGYLDECSFIHSFRRG